MLACVKPALKRRKGKDKRTYADRRSYLLAYYRRPRYQQWRTAYDLARHASVEYKNRHNHLMREQYKQRRERIFIRDDFTCHYCGFSGWPHELTVDHKTPSSRGGSNADDNLVTACGDCNRRKSAKSYDRYLAEIGREPSWITEDF